MDQFSQSPSCHFPAFFEQYQHRDLLTPSKSITPGSSMDCSFSSKSTGSSASFQYTQAKRDFEPESSNISLNQDTNPIIPSDAIEEFPQFNYLQTQYPHKTQSLGVVDQSTGFNSANVINTEIAKNIQWHEITNAINTARCTNLNDQNKAVKITNFHESFNLTQESTHFSLLNIENQGVCNEVGLQSTPISDVSHMISNSERNEPELKTEVGYNSIIDISKINELIIEMAEKHFKDIQNKYGSSESSISTTQLQSYSLQTMDESIKIDPISRSLDSAASNLSTEYSNAQQIPKAADNNNITVTSEEFHRMNDLSLNKLVDFPVAEVRKILERDVNLNCNNSIAQDSVISKNFTYDKPQIFIHCSTAKSITEHQQNSEFTNTFSTDKNASKCTPLIWDDVPSTVTDDNPQIIFEMIILDDNTGNKVSGNDDNEKMTDLPNAMGSKDDVLDKESAIYENSCHSDTSTSQAKSFTSKGNFKFEESVNEPTADRNVYAVPQHKSNRKKIIERNTFKAPETKKQKISSHILNDGFPVSTKIPKSNKESKVLSKHPSKSTKLKDAKKRRSRSKKCKQSHKFSEKSKLPELLIAPAFSKKRNIDSTEEHSSKHHKSKHPKILEDESLNSRISPLRKKDKQEFKTKFVADASNLFVPHKPVKKIDFDKYTKSSNDREKTGGCNAAKRFYGNRVTNQGAFLTQSSSYPPKVKNNSRRNTFNFPKEYHSLIESPDINISINQNYISHDIHESKLSKFHDQETFPRHFNENGNIYSNRINTLENEITISSPLGNRIDFVDGTSSSNDAFLSVINSTRKQVFQTDDDASFCRPSPIFASFQSPLYYTPPEGQERDTLSPPVLQSFFCYSPPKGQERDTLSPPGLQSSLCYSPPKGQERDIFVETLPPPELEESRMPSIHCSSSSNLQLMMVDQNLLKRQQLFKKNEKPTNAENSTHSSMFRNPEIYSEHSTSQIKRVLQSFSVDSDLAVRILRFGSIAQSPQFTEETCSISQINQDMNCGVTLEKCLCLVPNHLKSDVGRAVIDSINILLLILEWNVDWLFQQQKNTDPPPISKSVHKVSYCYQNYDDYYNTFLPLMLLETWQKIYISWTDLHQADPYFCEILSYTEENHYINVECQTAFVTLDYEKSVFPEEGNIIIAKFRTRNKGGIKMFGYITNIDIRPFNSGTNSTIFSNKNLTNVSDDHIYKLKLTFMGAYASGEFDKKQPIRIQVLCNIKSTLKQNDALLFVDKSPLHENILNSLDNGLSTVILRSRNGQKSATDCKECVKKISQSIVSPHPIMLLTTVEFLPSSHRLLVLPPLISKMKESHRTKVLLCTRTTKALTEIGLCLEDSELKLVIIGKRADTNGKLQKYLLGDLALSHINTERPNVHNLEDSILKGRLLKEQVKPEILTKAKKTVLNECDVILCLIRDSHDELIAQTFEEKDCIAHMCCIVDEANLCTEPETLIPLMYGISKLILIGDRDVSAKVCSKCAISYDYNRSLFHRAYHSALISY